MTFLNFTFNRFKICKIQEAKKVYKYFSFTTTRCSFTLIFLYTVYSSCFGHYNRSCLLTYLLKLWTTAQPLKLVPSHALVVSQQIEQIYRPDGPRR